MNDYQLTTDNLTHEQLPFDENLEVVLPGDEGWDAARHAWNLAADLNPDAVAFPRSAEHVREIVMFASETGLRVEVQTTGHGALAAPDLSGAILVRTSKMRGVTIDAERRIARAEAGVQWQEVNELAHEHGLIGLSGSAPDVGVAGYTLGGGMGWLAREQGLAANHVTAIEVVTADGELRRATAADDPDLFWALRGGGGGFGIVTAIEFELLPVGEVFAGMYAWPWERTAEVLKAWRDWTATAPESATSVGRILQFPPFEEIPEPMRGRSFVIVEIAFHGDETDGRELIAPLQELGPEIDTFASIPATALSQLHMDPPMPVAGITAHQLLDELPDETIDKFVEASGSDSGSILISSEFRHGGGALGRAPESGGAYANVPGEFIAVSVGPAADGAAPVSQGYLDQVSAALASDALATKYPNFVDEPVPAATFYDEQTLARLREVKERYDAGGTFVGALDVE